jgi:phosphate/sulfate permease/ABC-type spermidine/putrescine transport system permease subunit I
VLLVETVHLFPMMTLSILDALSRVDPRLEEAAEGMGATAWRRFRDITMPLTTPGYVSGALLVFIWTFADFITPLVLGVQDLLAPQAYLNIVQFVDRRIFRMGIVISALLVILAIVFVLAARQYVAIKDYSSLSYSKVERRALGPVTRWAAVGFLAALMAVSFIPQVGVLLAAVGRGWSLTPVPVEYTMEFFRQVSVETPKFILNSFLYCAIAVFLCLAIGVPMAWIMGRTKAPGRGAMDALTTLMLAIPGTAVGIARLQLPPPLHRPHAHRHVDDPAARARGAAPALHGARQLLVAAARAQLDGGGGRERGRHEAAHFPGHHRAARVEGDLRGRALLVHHVDPGGLVDDLPHDRRQRDDAVRHLHLLHRRVAEPGGGPRRDPDRGVRREPVRREPRRRHARGGALRMTSPAAILALLVAAAIAYEFVNGFHDGANIVSTIIASHAMGARGALALAAAASFAGPFGVGSAVGHMLGAGLVDATAVSVAVAVAALVAAVLWNLATWWLRIPVSSSHALVGALIGAALTAAGPRALHASGLATVAVSLFVAPLFAFAIALGVMHGAYALLRGATPRANVVLSRAQVGTAVALAYANGANDAHKTAGVIALGLPFGTLAGGGRIVTTLGARFYRIRPLHGFAAQTASAAVLLGASIAGGPVSSTQVTSLAIVGAGAGERPSKVRWTALREIAVAWLVTIPASALLAAPIYLGVRALVAP